MSERWTARERACFLREFRVRLNDLRGTLERARNHVDSASMISEAQRYLRWAEITVAAAACDTTIDDMVESALTRLDECGPAKPPKRNTWCGWS